MGQIQTLELNINNYTFVINTDVFWTGRLGVDGEMIKYGVVIWLQIY